MPRDTRHRMKLLPLFVTILLTTCARGVYAAEAFNFPPSDFEILSADSGQLIGHGHYRVEQAPGSLILHGENRYLNGEYDLEEDHLTTEPGAALPTLVTFRHDFFNADGTLLLVARLDSKTGTAICARRRRAGPQAGAVEIFRRHFCGRERAHPDSGFHQPWRSESTLKLHVFNCAQRGADCSQSGRNRKAPGPGPLPGRVERIDVKPNFGLVDDRHPAVYSKHRGLVRSNAEHAAGGRPASALLPGNQNYSGAQARGHDFQPCRRGQSACGGGSAATVAIVPSLASIFELREFRIKKTGRREGLRDLLVVSTIS